VPGSASSEAIDPDNEDHEAYLSKFKNKVTDKLRLLIEAHITNDPDVIKGRKKTVQVSKTKNKVAKGRSIFRSAFRPSHDS